MNRKTAFYDLKNWRHTITRKEGLIDTVTIFPEQELAEALTAEGFPRRIFSVEVTNKGWNPALPGDEEKFPAT